MAVRTTDAKVKAILLSQYDLDNTPALTDFITEANLLTDWVDTCDTDNDVSDALLTLIETNLAAHFYKIAEQGAAEEKTADASVTFRGESGMYLESTLFGQKAITLDVSGCLAKRNSMSKKGKQTISLDWLGKIPSNQIDYTDRD
tara:strand:+ start:22696 stop:23130 length:435 start_codon:yes stop_codon:yes gene_type:complete